MCGESPRDGLLFAIAARMAVAARTPKSLTSDSLLAQCTDLLARFATTEDRRLFDTIARIAEPYLLRRAHAEIAKRRAALDAQEVVQDALLNIFRYAASFRPTVPHAFATWSSRIVANVVLRLLRPRRSPKPISIHDVEGWDLPAGVCHDPVRQLDDSEERLRLRTDFALWLRLYYQAYLGLTKLQQEILHRVEIHGLSYSEIAAALEMRVDAVKMVVYRGRKKLQQEMQRMSGVAASA